MNLQNSLVFDHSPIDAWQRDSWSLHRQGHIHGVQCMWTTSRVMWFNSFRNLSLYTVYPVLCLSLTKPKWWYFKEIDWLPMQGLSWKSLISLALIIRSAVGIETQLSYNLAFWPAGSSACNAPNRDATVWPWDCILSNLTSNIRCAHLHYNSL